MQIESDRHTIANNSASQAALQRIHVVEAAKCSEKRSISRGWKVWLIPWIRLLLSVPLFSGIATFAQYNPLPSPIAEQEVAGPAQAAVRAGQNNPVVLSQNPYLGGVPAGQLSGTPILLSLEDAVARGLKQNLGGYLATDSVTDARGQKWEALSELLPNVTTGTGFGVRQIDLKAQFGLNIPGVPRVIGPFGYFDSRGYLKQTIFDWESIERVRSSQAELRSAEYGYKNAHELVVTVIVSNYLLVIADQSEVESARSQRDTAAVLFQQTSDQKTAGLAAAVDVLRSHLQLQSRTQKLIVAQNNLEKQKLVLARAIGLPPGQKLEIATQVGYQDLSIPPLDDAIQSAYKARADFQSQMNQVQSAELQRKASFAERYPSIEQVADYGITGVNPASTHGTVDAAVTLRVPVFQGGKVHADVLRADASLQRAKQVLEDLRAQIDQEVRAITRFIDWCVVARPNVMQSNTSTPPTEIAPRLSRNTLIWTGQTTTCMLRCLIQRWVNPMSRKYSLTVLKGFPASSASGSSTRKTSRPGFRCVLEVGSFSSSIRVAASLVLRCNAARFVHSWMPGV
jgi:outer membrane protein TolC